MRSVGTTLSAALLLALASSAVQGRRLEVQDWDCPPPPASCARPVIVVGFPLPYISDYHGLSPVGRASLSGALVGEDHFHWAAFLGDVAFYALLGAGAALVPRAVRRPSARTLPGDGDTARRPHP